MKNLWSNIHMGSVERIRRYASETHTHDRRNDRICLPLQGHLPIIGESAVIDDNSGTHLYRCNGFGLDIAKSVDAEVVMIGWIFKMSSLVLLLHIQMKDISSGKLTYSRMFDFPRDNEKVWQHAADNMIRMLAQANHKLTN
ncbi:MAG: DUF3280 domain-containing protein [Candidatus Thiodiazotropha sp. (ex Lucinoma annulata)]|nr:DUF3280 domain-containing protein [Candidatus Thiodiazotropha sp. (ex Lucinoma annulata)]